MSDEFDATAKLIQASRLILSAQSELERRRSEPLHSSALVSALLNNIATMCRNVAANVKLP